MERLLTTSVERDGAEPVLLCSNTYDLNGNMTRDLNKGIRSVTYNTLNQPQSVLFTDGHITRYTYAADGRKLRVEHLLSNFTITDPVGRLSGHALGGEAALNSLVTAGDGPGRKAITFNAAGVSMNTMVLNGAKIDNILNSKKLISAQILSSAPLNTIQNNNMKGIGLILPDVNGKVRLLRPVDLASILNGHSMDNILKCYGITNPIKYSKR